MAERRHYQDTDARYQTGMVQAVVDSPSRHAGKDAGQVAGENRFSNVAVAVVLGLWLAVVVLLGAAGAFVQPPGMPPYPIAIAITVPLIVFFVAFWQSAAFRKFVTTADLRLLTVLQAWRWAGFGFIALYAYGVLPGLFAWPAGLGDMAIGITAPWIARSLVRQPSFAGSRRFVIWNLLGILDLVVAVSIATILATGAVAAEVTVAPMAKLPLLLIPAYLVPLFIMFHLTALIQARRVALSGQGREGAPATSPGTVSVQS
jgi:hypothetical protein